MKMCSIQGNKTKFFIMAFAVVLTATTMMLAITGFCSSTATEPVNTDHPMTTVPPALTVPPEPMLPDEPSEPEWLPAASDVEYIAKTLYGECVGVKSDTEKAAVVWCILNRVDYKGYACGKSIEYVVTFPNQFQGYSPDHPVLDSLKNLAIDVLCRWHSEKEGETDVGRILPKEYIYFVGDGKANYFSKEYLGTDYWDFSLESPYED